MVLAHFDRWETLDTLRNDCGVTRDGSNAVAIVTAGSKYGLEFEAVRGTAVDLDNISAPAIIWWHRSHFMVLEGVHDGKFYVNDPARGQYVMDSDDFEAGYSGAAISFSKGSTFTTGGHKYEATPALWARLKNSVSGVRFAIF